MGFFKTGIFPEQQQDLNKYEKCSLLTLNTRVKKPPHQILSKGTSDPAKMEQQKYINYWLGLSRPFMSCGLFCSDLLSTKLQLFIGCLAGKVVQRKTKSHTRGAIIPLENGVFLFEYPCSFGKMCLNSKIRYELSALKTTLFLC